MSGYNLHALEEAFFSRYKHMNGDGLRFHTDDRQQTEIGVAVLILYRMLNLGRSDSVRIRDPPASFLRLGATASLASRTPIERTKVG